MSKAIKTIQDTVKAQVYNNAWAFCLYYDFEFFYPRSHFLQPIANSIQYLINGDADLYEKIKKSKYVTKITENAKSLGVSMPPRAGKSYTMTVCVAWALGRYPSESIMRNTCTHKLFEKFSYDTRDILRSEKFKSIFSDIQLSDDKQSLSGWNTNKAKQVSYFGAGVGGTIIGFGATLLAITDDLYRGYEDAISQTINEKTISWKQGTHDSRIEVECKKIDIGTRWTETDVIGQSEHDIQIVISALDENDKSFCELVKTTEQYHEIRRTIDTNIFSAEYMQKPLPAKGALFNANNLRFGDYDFVRENFEGVVVAVDSKDEGKDYFAAWFVGVSKIDKTCYPFDVIFNKNGAGNNLPLLADKCNLYGVDVVYMEINKEGAMLVNNFRNMITGDAKVIGIFQNVNKIVRISFQSQNIINNCLFLRKPPHNEYKQAIDNLYTFTREGTAVHDDSPDALSLAMRQISLMYGHE